MTSLFIFDWDDSLFATSVYMKSSLTPDQARLLEESMLRLLFSATRLGHVVIVTNSINNWVNKLSENLLPRVKNFLNGIPIIYAREAMAQSMWPQVHSQEEQMKVMVQNPFVLAEAKSWTFLRLFQQYRVKNYLAFGDHLHDRASFQKAMNNLPSVSFYKHFKLSSNPSFQRLLAEQTLLSGILDQLVSYQGHLDMQIEACPA